MLGDGSDVLGFDDDVSPDHDFGPRVQLVLPDGANSELLLVALARLPSTCDGYPVYYGSTTTSNGWSEKPAICTARGWDGRSRSCAWLLRSVP